MTELVSTGVLPFDGRLLTIYWGSDNRLYARFFDLCSLLGLDIRWQLTDIWQEGAIVDDLVELNAEIREAWLERRESLFLNLGALSHWLNTLRPDEIENQEQRQRVKRFIHMFRGKALALDEQGVVTTVSKRSKK